MDVRLAFAFTAALGATVSSATAAEMRLDGVFALPAATAKTVATLRVSRTGPTSARLDLTETAGGATIRNYDVDMTKRIHVIVIDDAFSSFQHVHPQLRPDGHFTLDLHVSQPGRYYVYADTMPHGIGQQVFRFTIPFGSASSKPAERSSSATTVASAPYSVSLDSVALRAGSAAVLGVRIEKAGKLARDLRPYLGGAAHAVFIDTKTLGYIHVHPMSGAEMPGMAAGGMDGMNMDASPLPDDAPLSGAMKLHVVVPLPGTYKLWFQFRGGDGLHVVPFVLRAR